MLNKLIPARNDNQPSFYTRSGLERLDELRSGGDAVPNSSLEYLRLLHG